MILRKRLGMVVATLVGGAFVALVAAASPAAAVAAALITAAILGVILSPSARQWVLGHSGQVRILGFALLVGGPLVLPLLAIAAGLYESNAGLVTGAGVVLGGLGAAAVILPTSLASAARDHARVRAVSHHRSGETPVSAVRLALGSFAVLARDALPLLRIFGPWAMLNWIVYVAADAAIARGGEATDLFPALLVLAAGVWMVLFTWPVLIVAWSRFVIERRYPPGGLALPDRAYLSVLWRGALLIGLLVTASEMAVSQAPMLAQLVGLGDTATVAGLLQAAAFLGGFLLMSSFALVIPARAAGDREMSSAISAACLGRFHGGHVLGLVLILAPFLVLRELLQALPPGGGFLLRAGLSLLMVAVNLAAVAAVTTFFARLYSDCRTIGLVEELEHDPQLLGKAA